MIAMADGSVKPIEALKRGDRVQGSSRINRVVDPEVHHTPDTLYSINKSAAFVTGGHLLMTTKGWRAIDPELALIESKGQHVVPKLLIGDILVMRGDARQPVKSIRGQRWSAQPLYNPALDGDHTYYANGLLVHNAKCRGCGINDSFSLE